MTNRIPGKDLVRGCGMSTQFRSTQGRTEVSVKISCQKPHWLFCLCHLERDAKASVCLRPRSDEPRSSRMWGFLVRAGLARFPQGRLFVSLCQEGEGEAKKTSFGTTSVLFWKVLSGTHVPPADDIGTFSVFPELCGLSGNDFIDLPSEDS